MSNSDVTTTYAHGLLNQQQLQGLDTAVQSLNQQQLIWASGYLAGRAVSPSFSSSLTAGEAQQQTNPQQAVTVMYASQTGNSKGVANDYAEQLKHLGFDVSLTNSADYKLRQLKKERILIIVASTHGEGEPPDDAIAFYDFIFSAKAPKLPDLSFAVLGLGDTSYEHFCKTAQDIDEQLNTLGANRLLERVDCDVDYELTVSNWASACSSVLKETFSIPPLADVVTLPQATQSQYSKSHPFKGALLANQKVTGRYSSKDIRHIEISLEDSDLSYSPGDALGVWFENDESLVESLLLSLGIDSDVWVIVDGESKPIKQALKAHFELTQSYPSFVEKYAMFTQQGELLDKLNDKAALRDYLKSKQIIDIVQQYPAQVEAQRFVEMLRKLTPRLYSIASSQAEVEEEVHLTVAVVETHDNDEVRQGGASCYLSKRIAEGAPVKVFIESNTNFRLPQSTDTPIIMIGPGTGVAPFRGFLQQREAEQATGKNWLFFGNPSFSEDFLYQVEWQRYLKSGLLNKLSLAFSRDQADKIYVQDRIREHGQDFCDWLERGAHVYVCGDAQRMAKDVHQAMKEVLQTHQGKSSMEAEEYLTTLKKAKRYQKDVY